jgi:hypothetical protein
MIYFIQDETSGLIKIGLSKTPWRRLVMLQTGSASRRKEVFHHVEVSA